MGARSQFAAGIGQVEGYGPPANRPTRNNNPGDLRNWPGVPKDSGNYSIFPTPQAGWDALESELDDIRSGTSQYYNSSMTFAQMGAVWAGGDSSWGRNLAAFFGTSPNAMIGQFLGASSVPQFIGPLQIPVGPTDAIQQAVVAAQSPEDLQRILLVLAGMAVLFVVSRDIFS